MTPDFNDQNHVYREVSTLYAINQAAVEGCVIVTAHYDPRGYWVTLMLDPVLVIANADPIDADGQLGV